MLSAHRAASRFRGESAVTTWLHRIVVNACVDRMRRRKSHRTVPLPGTGGEGGAERSASRHELAAPATDPDTAMIVREALAPRPFDPRAALVLVDLQGHTVAEVAVMMGVAEGTIKSRCSRGRARLATLLGYLRNPEPSGFVPPDTTTGGVL